MKILQCWMSDWKRVVEWGQEELDQDEHMIGIQVVNGGRRKVMEMPQMEWKERKNTTTRLSIPHVNGRTHPH